MKLGIMQPYFAPYLGYFQLINAVDKFVVYDDIQYTKKSWIRRNRVLCGHQPEWLIIPLESSSDTLDICKKHIAPDFDRKKMLRKLKANYERAPFFETIFPLAERIITYEKRNLFDFLLHSLNQFCAELRIKTPIVISSTLGIDPTLRSQARVIATAMSCQADSYINPIGGIELYDSAVFAAHGIDLHFLKMKEIHYPQWSDTHVPYLSILDVLMFNSPDRVQELLGEYTLTCTLRRANETNIPRY